MDLIYTNKNNVEIGILQNYDLDLAFGSDENNFELVVTSDSNVLEIGSHFYFESTEYGGIVDAIAVDTETSEVTYSGRTWHGVLAGKVIVPPAKNDYMTLSGDANSVLRMLISSCGLDSLFYVIEENSGFYIDNVQFRYSNLYESIAKMLADVNARLGMYRIGRMVIVSAVPLINYSTNEEWDLAHKTFKAENVVTRTNHLICLGKGELRKRKVIHLFADQNGNVQPYATVDEPYSDSHYIKDKRNQVIFGADEIVEVYDNSNAAITENYILTEECPSDWGKHYADYFYREDEEFKNVESTEGYEIKPLTEIPPDWSSKYGNYYVVETGQAVTGTSIAEWYENLPKTETPSVSDWKKNFAKYYFWDTDGVTGKWSQVRGVDVHKYKEQTEVPSDWTENWSNYYIYWHLMEQVKKQEYKDDKGKTHHKVPTWVENKYYKKTDAGNYTLLKSKPAKWDSECEQYFTFTKSDYVKVSDKYSKKPTWKKKTIYTDVVDHQKAPVWDPIVQYAIKHPAEIVAPTWESNVYGRKREIIVKPIWIPDTYYKLYEDAYAELVKGGIEKMNAYKNADSIEMSLPADGYEYFIGDIVGATAESQGFSVEAQSITKKIVTINKEGINISYSIGGK